MSAASSARAEVRDHGYLRVNVEKIPCHRCGVIHPYWVMPVAGRCVPCTFPPEEEIPWQEFEARWPEPGMEIYALDLGGNWHLVTLFG